MKHDALPGALLLLLILITIAFSPVTPEVKVRISPRVSAKPVAPLVVVEIPRLTPDFYCPRVRIDIGQGIYVHEEESDCAPWEQWTPEERNTPLYLSHRPNRLFGEGEWGVRVEVTQGERRVVKDGEFRVLSSF